VIPEVFKRMPIELLRRYAQHEVLGARCVSLLGAGGFACSACCRRSSCRRPAGFGSECARNDAANHRQELYLER
jgi:hypothetical protein